MATMPIQVAESLRHSGYWRWSLGAQLARLPGAMAPLAYTLLAIATTGSYRLGGLMMAAFVMATIVGAIPCARLVDAVGPTRGLRLLLAVGTVGFCGLSLAATAGVPGPVLLALVVVPGAIGGGISGGLRALLGTTVSPPLLPRAIAVDMTVVEGVLIIGPVVASAAALASPTLAISVMALAGLTAIVLVPRGVRLDGPDRRRSTAGPVPLRALTGWLAVVYAIGQLPSAIEVGPVPLVHRVGAATASAPVVSVTVCVASITGGVLYAWRGTTLRWSPRDLALGMLGLFVLGATVIITLPDRVGLATGTALVGLATAPLGSIASTELGRILPAGREAEGFSAVVVAQDGGFVIGSLSVGLLSTSDSIGLGALAAVVAGVVLIQSDTRSAAVRG